MSSTTKWVGQRNNGRENMLSCKIRKTLYRSDQVLPEFLLDLPSGTSMRLGRPLFKNAGKVRGVAPIPEM